MKKIQLSQNKIAFVSDEDFDYLNQFKWYAVKQRTSNWYAVRTGYRTKTGAGNNIYMHREILGLIDPKIKCDHIDHNGLNCQRNNLRITDNSGNNSNRTSAKNSTSKYLGVHHAVFKKGTGRREKDYIYWRAVIKKNGIIRCLGSFHTEEDAARAYNKAAIEIHGEFANPNII